MRRINRILDVPFDYYALFDHLAELVRHESARSCDARGRTKFCQKVNVRACDTRVKYVADDRYLQASYATLVLAYGQSIE
jgi:hypothetical protein